MQEITIIENIMKAKQKSITKKRHKEIKREYRKNRYINLSEDTEENLREYRKNCYKQLRP